MMYTCSMTDINIFPSPNFVSEILASELRVLNHVPVAPITSQREEAGNRNGKLKKKQNQTQNFLFISHVEFPTTVPVR